MNYNFFKYNTRRHTLDSISTTSEVLSDIVKNNSYTMSLSYISNSRFNTLILLYVECIPLLLLLASVTTKHSYVHHMTSLGTVYPSYMHSLQFFSAFNPGLKISVPYKLIYTLIAQYYFKNISQFCFPILLFIVNLLIKKANTSLVVGKKYIQTSNFYH